MSRKSAEQKSSLTKAGLYMPCLERETCTTCNLSCCFKPLRLSFIFGTRSLREFSTSFESLLSPKLWIYLKYGFLYERFAAPEFWVNTCKRGTEISNGFLIDLIICVSMMNEMKLKTEFFFLSEIIKCFRNMHKSAALFWLLSLHNLLLETTQ